MVRKSVTLILAARDDSGQLTGGSLSISGTTDDEGQSVEIGLGYLPGATEAQPGDIWGEFATVTAAPILHTQPVIRELFEVEPGGEVKQRLWFVDPPASPKTPESEG